MKKKEPIKLRHKDVEKALNQLRDTYRDAMILLSYKEGVSITKIAEEQNLNKSTVSRIIKNNKKLLDRMGE